MPELHRTLNEAFSHRELETTYKALSNLWIENTILAPMNMVLIDENTFRISHHQLSELDKSGKVLNILLDLELITKKDDEEIGEVFYLLTPRGLFIAKEYTLKGKAMLTPRLIN
jgi:hypothetical protein